MAIENIACSNLTEVMERLRAGEVEGDAVYRGQLARRPVHRFESDGYVTQIENLYPGSFRFIAAHETVSPELESENARRNREADASFMNFSFHLYSQYYARREAEPACFGWMDPYAKELDSLFGSEDPSLFDQFHRGDFGLHDPAFVRITWALAQHYGIVTALLDLTYSPEVAAWFASNPWDEVEGFVAEGEGVIYEISLLFLQAIIIKANREFRAPAERFAAPSGRFFLSDLRGLPPAFAARPARQQAAAMRGFDDLRFCDLIGTTPQVVIRAFTFPHQLGEFERLAPTILRAHDIIPESDPFLELRKSIPDGDSAFHWVAEAADEVARFDKPVTFIVEGRIKHAQITDAPDAIEDQTDTALQAIYVGASRDLERGRLPEGVEELSRVISLAESHPTERPRKVYVFAHIALAKANADLGRHEAAEAAMTALLGLLEVAREEDWFAEAAEWFVDAASLVAQRFGDATCRKYLRSFVCLVDPTSSDPTLCNAIAQAGYLLGLCNLGEDQPGQGERQLEETSRTFASGSTPRQRLFAAASLFQLAKHLAREGRTDEAVDTSRRLIEEFGWERQPEILEFSAWADHYLKAQA